LEEGLAAGHGGQFTPCGYTCQHCDTHYFSRPRTRNLPIVGVLLVRRGTSSATDSRVCVQNFVVVRRGVQKEIGPDKINKLSNI